MKLGLRIALASFQSALYIILSRFQSKSCLVNVNDAVSFSKISPASQGHQRRSDFTQPGWSDSKVPKHHFFQMSIKYFGSLFMPDRLLATHLNIDAIKTAVFSTNSIQMKFFLGTNILYIRFAKDFSKTSRLRNDYLRKERNWIGRTLQLKFYKPFISLNLSW